MRHRRRQRIADRQLKIGAAHDAGRVDEAAHILLAHDGREVRAARRMVSGKIIVLFDRRRENVEVNRDVAVLLAHGHGGDFADREPEILDRRTDRQPLHRRVQDRHGPVARLEQLADADRNETDDEESDRDQQESPEFQPICFIHDSIFP